MDHKYLKCFKPCERLFKNCSCDHKCDGVCFEDCRNCPIFLAKILPKCGHSKNMRCSEDSNAIKCKEKVLTELECNHSKVLFCYKYQVFQNCFKFYGSCRDLSRREDPSKLKDLLEGVLIDDFNCKEIVHKTFKECEHTLNIECYKKDSIICQQNVFKELKCGHSVLAKCSTEIDTIECLELTNTELKCGHYKDVVCFKKQKYLLAKDSKCELKEADYKCESLIDKSFKNCSHITKIKCCEQNSIKVCTTTVSKELKCGHSITINCHLDPNQHQCMQLVELKLDCGHITKVRCHEEQEYQILKNSKSQNNILLISQFVCREIVEKVFQDCKHIIKVECCEKNSLKFQSCNEIVSKKLNCGHFYKTNCCEDPNQNKCLQSVELKLNCGHFKRVKCHEEQEYKTEKLKNSIEDSFKILLESDQFICHVIVEKRFQACNHTLKVKL